MNADEQNRNTIDMAKLINASVCLNNLLDLARDMPDECVEIDLVTLEQFKSKNPDIYKALKQYDVLINIIGAIQILSNDIEKEIGTLCEALEDEEIL